MSKTIDLSSTQVIPKEGYFKPRGKYTTIQLFSSDLGSETLAFAPEASLTPELESSWDVMQESGSDVSIDLASGVSCVRTFQSDHDIFMRYKFTTGTGVVTYIMGGDEPEEETSETPEDDTPAMTETNLLDQGLTSSSIDERLIYLESIGTTGQVIDIRGNDARTSASDDAVTSLTTTLNNILLEDA